MKFWSHKRWFFTLGVMWFAAMSYAQDWQRKAVEAYPQLGISGSAQNTRYWALHKERLRTNPDFFKNPQWPYLLAKESGDLCKIQPVTPPATPQGPAESPETVAGKKLLVAKCGRCHEAPDATVEEKAWGRALDKWMGKAKLTKDEYDQLVAYGSRARAAAASASASVDPGKKLYVAKCGRCHEAYTPGVDEMTWNRWIWKWKNRAGLTDSDYDQLMDYARRVRESRAVKTGQ